MRNKPFFLPVLRPDELLNALGPGNLKNKCFGKVLFRTGLYQLVTGNVSILENISNDWYIRELLNYANETHDPNILKALRKVASTDQFHESIRQNASEIAEIIDDEQNGKHGGAPPGKISEKARGALQTLAGIRYPQTTEVLRLLRDKSPEIKRLALWLIGKFRMTDLSQEVCECLAVRDLEGDAVSVLESLGKDAGPELRRFYLASAGNIEVSRSILRLLSGICPEECMPFLLERLWSTSRQLRETALNELTYRGYIAGEDERKRIRKLIMDTFRTLTWIVSVRVCLEENNDPLLKREADKEFDRWKEFLLRLIRLAYGDSIPLSQAGGEEGDDPGSVRELAAIVFTGHGPAGPDDKSNAAANRKMFKKLQHYFPVLVPDYVTLHEDIINYDYNVISIWTKACAIRSIREIGSENLGESIAALLFSPEEILVEEAVQLISRSGKSADAIMSDRIPAEVRAKLEDIISGRFDRKGLIYEKVRFLSRNLVPVIEEELISLAEQLIFVKELPGEKAALSDAVLWILDGKEGEPAVIINHAGNSPAVGNPGKPDQGSSCYALPFSAITDFCYRFPGNSVRIYSYIDKHEE